MRPNGLGYLNQRGKSFWGSVYRIHAVFNARLRETKSPAAGSA